MSDQICVVCGGATCPHIPRVRPPKRYPFAKVLDPTPEPSPRRARHKVEDRMRRPETHEREREDR